MGSMKWLRKRSFWLAPVFFAFFLTASPSALAHAQLLSSSITDGASLDTFPEVITLTFNEELINLESKSGKSATQVSLQERVEGAIDLQVEILGAKLVITPSALINSNSNSRAGEYALKFRVVSNDGHVISGELSFTVLADKTSEKDSGNHLESKDTASEEDEPMSSLLLVALIVLALTAAAALLIQSGNKGSV
jgi:copper resistance protein C